MHGGDPNHALSNWEPIIQVPRSLSNIDCTDYALKMTSNYPSENTWNEFDHCHFKMSSWLGAVPIGSIWNIYIYIRLLIYFLYPKLKPTIHVDKYTMAMDPMGYWTIACRGLQNQRGDGRTLGIVPLIITPIYTFIHWVILLGPKKSPWPRGADFRFSGTRAIRPFVPQNLVTKKNQRFLSEQRLGMMSILHL